MNVAVDWIRAWFILLDSLLSPIKFGIIIMHILMIFKVHKLTKNWRNGYVALSVFSLIFSQEFTFIIKMTHKYINRVNKKFSIRCVSGGKCCYVNFINITENWGLKSLVVIQLLRLTTKRQTLVWQLIIIEYSKNIFPINIPIIVKM